MDSKVKQTCFYQINEIRKQIRSSFYFKHTKIRDDKRGSKITIKNQMELNRKNNLVWLKQKNHFGSDLVNRLIDFSF